MTLQSGLQTTAVHILLNISQRKGNQTMRPDNEIWSINRL